MGVKQVNRFANHWKGDVCWLLLSKNEIASLSSYSSPTPPSSAPQLYWILKVLNRKYYCFYDYLRGFKCNVLSDEKIM